MVNVDLACFARTMKIKSHSLWQVDGPHSLPFWNVKCLMSHSLFETETVNPHYLAFSLWTITGQPPLPFHLRLKHITSNRTPSLPPSLWQIQNKCSLLLVLWTIAGHLPLSHWILKDQLSLSSAFFLKNHKSDRTLSIFFMLKKLMQIHNKLCHRKVI